MKSNLDLTIISDSGMVGFFDAKSFDSNFFTYSKIDSEQIKRADEYNRWSVPAGFIVLFREINRISFYSGSDLIAGGPGHRFLLTDGLLLGRLETFDLRLLFAK